VASWVAEEIRGTELPDVRLEEGLVLMVERLAAQPEVSIPQAMGSWTDTKAAYRFLDSDRVSPEAIRAGHVQSCVKRVGSQSRVLIVQDTTTLDFTHHPGTKGLGYLDHPSLRGLVMHTGLACTVEGVPLGILTQDIWVRDPDNLGKSEDRRKRRFGDKESAKWVKALQAAFVAVPESIETVTVADSEADVFELFAAERPAKAHLLVRATHNRRVEGEVGYLWQEVGASPVRGEIRVELEATEKRAARIARCEVCFHPVIVRPPRNPSPGQHRQAISLQAVLVLEEDAPEGVEPLCWLLLTTLRVESFADALQCVKYYGLRWLVERYHLVLKSGCRVERLQLETAERIGRAVAAYSLVAWRLLWLTYEARKSPEASCECALEPQEWQSLYCTTHKTRIPPSEPPTLRQAVRWIAQLGGFMGRKGDGEPGVMVLWRGLRRLEDIASTWLLLYHTKDVGNA